MQEKDLLEIEAKLRDIIVSVADFEIDKDTIEEGKDGIKKLGLNSLAVIRMMVEIEKEFDIEMNVDDENSDILYSICDLAKYIFSQKSVG